MRSPYMLFVVKPVRAVGRWLYAIFASVKTSVYLTVALAVFFTIGTIFPQGREYAAEGGFGLKLARFFDVLDVFTSPIFLMVVVLFFINLTVFLIDYYHRLRGRPEERPFEEGSFPQNRGVIRIHLARDLKDPAVSIKRSLREIGFAVRSFLPHSSLARGVARRGLRLRWLSFITHLAVWFLMVGFLVSYLTAFEGEIVIFPGERKFVSTHSSDTRLGKLLTGLRREPPKGDEKKGFKLELERFITEYVPSPKLNYPKRVKDRIAFAVGMHPERLRYTVEERALFPKDWKSVLTVYEKGKPVKSKTIEVNHPLRHGGMVFYQAFYSQKLKVSVEETGDIYDVETGEPFEVAGVEGRFKLGTLYVGDLYSRDGSIQAITPFVRLSFSPDPSDLSSEQTVGYLVMGKPIKSNGVTFRLESYREGTGLTYRKDPGRPLLYVSSYVFVIALLIRIFAPWHLIQYMVKEEGEGAVMFVRMFSGGFMADEKKILGRLNEKIWGEEPSVIEADVESMDRPPPADGGEGNQPGADL